MMLVFKVTRSPGLEKQPAAGLKGPKGPIKLKHFLKIKVMQPNLALKHHEKPRPKG